MAQTPYDYFMKPFRAFGITLRPEAETTYLDLHELSGGRNLTFACQNNRFNLYSGSPEGGVGIIGDVLRVRNRGPDVFLTDHLWKRERDLPTIIAGSWTELADLYEPRVPLSYFPPEPDDPIQMDEATFRANWASLLAFLRFIDQEPPVAFEALYEFTIAPFQATWDEINQASRKTEKLA